MTISKVLAVLPMLIVVVALTAYRTRTSATVAAAITLWNTAFLDHAFETMEQAGTPVPPEYVPHISPLGWEHITLTGTYHWKSGHNSTWGRFRPLRRDAIDRLRAKSA